jgi:TolB protein
VFLFFVGLATGAQAQDTTRVPTGVELIGRYNVSKRPLVVVRRAEGAPDAGQQITSILQRDLQFSDRFEMGEVPAQLAVGAVDYRAWNSLNVWFLIAPVLTPSGGGYQLRVDIHDIVYGTLKGSFLQQLPAANAPGFRRAVHAASDEVVRLLTGQPGIATTRIAYSRRAGSGYEIMLVDYDGENAERLLASAGMIYSPTWSPDGRKLAYGVRAASGKVELHERDMATGRVRVISARPEFSYAPAYSPDGRKMAFSVSVGSLTAEINEYDLANNCCMKRLSRSSRNDLSPSYSPDGGRIVFNSDRLGQLHIYVMSAAGGEATLISPYNYGEPGYYAAPDWSPTNDEIVFAGRSRGEYQIMIARANRPGVAQQLTSSGRNEDPSWAPDGRHIVFSGVGRAGSGLYVIDSQTGTIRRVVAGSRLQMADWSPVLMRSASAPVNSN